VPSCPRRRRSQDGHRDLHRDLQSDLQTFLVIHMTHWKEPTRTATGRYPPLLFSNVRAFFRRLLRSRVEQRRHSPTLPTLPTSRRHVAHVAHRMSPVATSHTSWRPRHGTHRRWRGSSRRPLRIPKRPKRQNGTGQGWRSWRSSLHAQSCAGARNAAGFPARRRSLAFPTHTSTTWSSARTRRTCPWPPGTGVSCSTCGRRGRGHPNLHRQDHLHLQKTRAGEPPARGTPPQTATRRLGSHATQERGTVPNGSSSSSLEGSSSSATSTTRG
jgi:hypothetical protein